MYMIANFQNKRSTHVVQTRMQAMDKNSTEYQNGMKLGISISNFFVTKWLIRFSHLASRSLQKKYILFVKALLH